MLHDALELPVAVAPLGVGRLEAALGLLEGVRCEEQEGGVPLHVVAPAPQPELGRASRADLGLTWSGFGLGLGLGLGSRPYLVRVRARARARARARVRVSLLADCWHSTIASTMFCACAHASMHSSASSLACEQVRWCTRERKGEVVYSRAQGCSCGSCAWEWMGCTHRPGA